MNHRLCGYSKWIGATGRCRRDKFYYPIYKKGTFHFLFRTTFQISTSQLILIFTVECAALLRYFGIRAVIVDFPEGLAISSDQHPTLATGNKVTGKRPFEVMTAESADNNSISGVLTISERIVRWVERFYNSIPIETAANINNLTDSSQASQSGNDDYFQETFLPPVYCQHQGHSRTIVGVQYSSPICSTLTTKKSGAGKDSISHAATVSTTTEKQLEQLLVFNPSSDATLARDSLVQGTLRWRPQICKNLNSFQKDSYQLVYIAPGMMTEQERLRSRLLVGTHETAAFLRTL